MDLKNILRLDIERIYHETEQRSVDIAESVDPTGETHDVIVICGADYPQLHTFLVRGTSEIADKANYIKCANETGLDAITASCPPEYCCTDDLSKQPQETKLKGELLDTDYSNVVVFNIPELENVELERRTIVQSYLHEAIICFLLYKWYQLKAKPDLMNMYKMLFDDEVGKVRFNSVTNIKRKNYSRRYNYY
jgi:hypothetical protein